MNTQKTILIVALLFLLGCSDKNPHKGLYNALFTDYDKRLSTLDENLTEVKKNEVELEEEHQSVDQNITEKEQMLNLYEEIDKVSFELDSLDIEDREKLDKIKKIIYRMKKITIKNYH